MADIIKIENYLENSGWTRQYAGSTDFDTAVNGIAKAIDNNLGIFVGGPTGSGKTSLIKTVAAAFGHYRYINCKRRCDVEKLTQKWQTFYAEDLHSENVVIDDVGAELPTYVDYIKRNFVHEFLIDRSERFANGYYQSKGKYHDDFVPQGFFPAPRLFGATNLNTEQFVEHFDGRAFSRLHSICIVFTLHGSDKRILLNPANKKG